MDPHNLKVACNYSEFYNSFLIQGEESRLPGYGGQRRMNVYLPASYSSSRQYPVLYMLPGGGDDEDTWIDTGIVRARKQNTPFSGLVQVRRTWNTSVMTLRTGTTGDHGAEILSIWLKSYSNDRISNIRQSNMSIESNRRACSCSL